ncbi:MAG: flagellar hook-associated protein FlgK [Bryobacteraceae bacterium]
MANLFSALRNSAEALKAFERSLYISQNNISNVNTPGYAKQRQALLANAFQVEQGLLGGVTLGEIESARNYQAEETVRRRQFSHGETGQLRYLLSQIEPLYNATGESGIPAAIDRLFQSFSGLTATPNDALARREVLSAAGEAARSFQATANGLERAFQSNRGEIVNTVAAVNRLTAVLQGYNSEIRRSLEGANDPGIDARIHSTLEDLSRYVDLGVVRQTDGTFVVTLSQGTQLVAGDRRQQLSVDQSGAAVEIFDEANRPVAAEIASGILGAALRFDNQIVPGLRTDLNRLAGQLADRVNQTLANGIDSNGLPGGALFTYNAGTEAISISATALTAGSVAAASTGAPGGNGNALDLAALSQSLELDGLTFGEFYANGAAVLGRQVADAKEGFDSQTQLLNQARFFRERESAVSLDEEATRIIEFQRAYQASARLVTVLDELAETVLGLVR